MPQVARAVVKERARRLREKGEEALRRHLASEVGARRQVLVETNDMGRTEHYLPARLAGPAEPGAIVRARVSGHDGRQLMAEVR